MMHESFDNLLHIDGLGRCCKVIPTIEICMLPSHWGDAGFAGSYLFLFHINRLRHFALYFCSK